MAYRDYQCLHNEQIYDGVFDIIKFENGEFRFCYLDERNYYNVFKTMQDFMFYWDGRQCEERDCFLNVYLEENHPDCEEGVDALDRYLRALPVAE